MTKMRISELIALENERLELTSKNVEGMSLDDQFALVNRVTEINERINTINKQ